MSNGELIGVAVFVWLVCASIETLVGGVAAHLWLGFNLSECLLYAALLAGITETLAVGIGVLDEVKRRRLVRRSSTPGRASGTVAE